MNSSNQIYQARINKVIDYVNNNLTKTISLSELAAEALFSPFHFHRIFVAVTGESINFFTNRVRLEKAARLLKFSKKSIGDVSIECGFSSPSTLSRSFKKYFAISPSAYRKDGKIENSKICKELFPLNEYLEPMTDAELKSNFPVVIKELPHRRVAYIRVVDSYREGVVQEAFEKLIAWARQERLFDSETIFGMSIDDPMTTPKEKYRYEACITIPDSYKKIIDERIDVMEMPKCKYAVIHVTGHFTYVATATHYLFNSWLVNSSYEPEHLHGLEIFLDKENINNWEHFDLELCLPVKAISRFTP